MKRLLVLLAIPAAVVAASTALTAGAAPTAAKTNECKGLKVCVRVAGPWVVVPSALSVPRAPVVYQLSCPKGYIVGGLDAELSDRGIDISFAARLGSPVNPGISTGRDAFLTATYVGSAPKTPSFRPHIGCMPGSGGGGRIQTVASATFKPGQPVIRRALNAKVVPGSQRVTATCNRGERLVGSWTAFGFRSPTAPTAPMVASVGGGKVLAVSGRRVSTVVRSAPAAVLGNARVQVGAVCAVAK